MKPEMNRIERPRALRRSRRRQTSTWATAAAAAAASATLSARPALADMVYESATMGSALQTSGVPLDTFNGLGVRFQVSDFATVDRIGAHLGAVATPSDTLWSELVQLSGPGDFPNPDESDVLATATFITPHASAEMVEAIPSTLLTPGWYALVFGGARFGGSAHGGFA